MIEEFNVDSKAECDQRRPNLTHETETNKLQCSISSVQVKTVGSPEVCLGLVNDDEYSTPETETKIICKKRGYSTQLVLNTGTVWRTVIDNEIGLQRVSVIDKDLISQHQCTWRRHSTVVKQRQCVTMSCGKRQRNSNQQCVSRGR